MEARSASNCNNRVARLIRSILFVRHESYKTGGTRVEFSAIITRPRCRSLAVLQRIHDFHMTYLEASGGVVGDSEVETAKQVCGQ
jgi:hypothetical protein